MNKKQVSVDATTLNRVMTQLTSVIAESQLEGTKKGLFHMPISDHDALWVASDLIEKSGKFPSYKLTFYHEGMGKGTNTCAVTFIQI